MGIESPLSSSTTTTLDAETDRLTEVEAHFQILSELTSDFVYSVEVGADGRFKNFYLNNAFLRVFGRDLDELKRLGWQAIVHPGDHPAVRTRLADLIAGRSFHGEFRVINREREHRVIEDRARPVLDPQTGRVVKIFGAARDITDQRLAAEQLRQSEAKYRQLVENSPFPVLIHCDEKVVFANQALIDLLAADTVDLFVGSSIFEDLHPEDREGARRRVQRLYSEKGLVESADVRLCRRDGQVLEVELVACRIELDGRPAAQVVLRDVTALRRATRARRELEAAALHAQKLESLGALAAGIAHDFNNVLVAVLGHADLALESLPANSPAIEHLEEVGRSAQLAADLAQQLLDYSGKARFKSKEVDLSRLIAEMDRLLAVSIKKRAALDYDLAPNLPLLEADPNQIRQIVMNLVMNAADAMISSSGAPTIAVRTGLSHDPAGPFAESFLGTVRDAVFVEVADRGCGMDERTRRQLFDPFFTTKPTGRGLGMAIVLGIVRGHGGALAVESTPGRGTTIRVLFPVEV